MVPYQNSTMFAAALEAHGVPFELHVFDKGPHGLGLDQSHPWAAACSHWLAGVDDVADRAWAAYLRLMNRARHAATTIGRILIFTSLMAVVLVLALWTSGPVLVVAIFSAVVVLVPLSEAPRAPAPVFIGVRRRRFASRAPPTF